MTRCSDAGHRTLRKCHLCDAHTICQDCRRDYGAAPGKTALRNHALADLEREASILDEGLADAQKGGIVVIPQLKPLIEE